MITPDPAADAQRRRGLRRMRTLAVSLLVFAAVVYLVTLGQRRLLGLRQRRRRGVDGRCDRRLVRGDRALQAPARAARPAHRADPAAQGRARPRASRSSSGENFLQEAIIRERIASATISLRVGQWLAEPAHVRRVVDEVAEVASIGLGKVRDEHIADFVTDALIPRFREEPLAPLAGGLLAEVVRDDVHHGLVDLTVDELHRWLVEHPDTFAEVLEQRAPWWAPPRLNDAVTRRLHTEAAASGSRRSGTTPHHQARQAFDSMLTQLAHDLQHDPDTQERTERLKERLLEHPQVVESSVALWNALRRALQASLVDPDGAVRERLCAELAGVRRAAARRTRSCGGGWTASPPTSRSSRSTRYGAEVTAVITHTIERWDGKEAARRIELHVGRDLQFIRINGTIVGGLVGVLIHTVAVLVG